MNATDRTAIWTITDTITGEIFTGDQYAIADKLADWYKDMPADMAETIANMLEDPFDEAAQAYLAYTVKLAK